jgi:hypothetical protein
MITPNLLPLDVEAILSAPPELRMAVINFWNASLRSDTQQTDRDECERGVGRFLIHYLLPKPIN